MQYPSYNTRYINPNINFLFQQSCNRIIPNFTLISPYNNWIYQQNLNNSLAFNSPINYINQNIYSPYFKNI